MSRIPSLVLVGALALGVLALPAAAHAAVPPVGEPRFVQVEPGDHFMVALTAEGEVYTWGDNFHGQLGDDGPFRASPAAISLPGLPVDDRIVQVAAGADHVLAVSEQGRIFGWGENGDGQVGDGSGDDRVPVPVLLDALPGLAPGDRAVAVAAGNAHSLALTARGEVYAWGWNEFAQADYDSWDANIVEPRLTPVGGVFGSAEPVTSIEAGAGTSFALADDGFAIAWGFNGAGQLGIGTTGTGGDAGVLDFPFLSGEDRIVQLSAGDDHGLAVSERGRVYAWGAGDEGQLGLGDGGDELSPVRVADFPALGDDRVVGVSAGVYYSLAVTEQGRVYAWGNNGWNGEGVLGLGLDEEEIRDTPTLVPEFPAVKGDSPLVAVRASSELSAAVSETGGVYTWGAGGAGGLGNGGFDDATRPVNIVLGELAGSVALGAAPRAGTPVAAVATGWPAGAVLEHSWLLDGAPLDGAEGTEYLPAAGDVGAELVARVTATAENWASGEAESDPAVVVAAPLPPAITTETLPPATAGVPYTAAVAATGTGPLSFEVTDGALPAGIVLDAATGALSGETTTAGAYRFEATVTSDHGSDARELELEVVPDGLAALDLDPSATEVEQGGWVEIEVTGVDAHGNPTGDLTDDVVLTSDVPSDVIEGNRITFPHASPHTITAAFGQLSASVTIEVRSAAGGAGDDSGDEELLGVTGVVPGAALLGALALAGGGIALLARRRRALSAARR